MDNTSNHFESEITNLGYSTIEREISDYFSMGDPDSSSIPLYMREDSHEDCTLSCTQKSGDFYIKNYKLNNGKYMLTVTLKGKLNRTI